MHYSEGQEVCEVGIHQSQSSYAIDTRKHIAYLFPTFLECKVIGREVIIVSGDSVGAFLDQPLDDVGMAGFCCLVQWCSLILPFLVEFSSTVKTQRDGC